LHNSRRIRSQSAYDRPPIQWTPAKVEPRPFLRRHFPARGTSPASMPAFFRHLESVVAQLRDLNIEADLISRSLRPRRLGFDLHSRPTADSAMFRYLSSSRFPPAYRNVCGRSPTITTSCTRKQGIGLELPLSSCSQNSDPPCLPPPLDPHSILLIYGQQSPCFNHASIQNVASSVEDAGRECSTATSGASPSLFSTGPNTRANIGRNAGVQLNRP